MGILMGTVGKLFTWWDGATIGTLLDSARHGQKVGTDHQGNTYYRAKKRRAGGAYGLRERRWVIYNGANDASRVPAEWHGWLHGSFDDVPASNLPPPHIWEADYTPNATGTPARYLPPGALGARPAATGDYEAWLPEGARVKASPEDGKVKPAQAKAPAPVKAKALSKADPKADPKADKAEASTQPAAAKSSPKRGKTSTLPKG